MSIPEWCQPVDLPSTGGAATMFFIGLAALVGGVAMIILARRRGLHPTAAVLVAVAMVAAGLSLGARTTGAAAPDTCPPGYELIPGATPPTVTEPTDPPTSTDPPAPTTATLTVTGGGSTSNAFTVFTPDGQASGGSIKSYMQVAKFNESLGELVGVALTFNYSYTEPTYRVTNATSSPLELTLETAQEITFSGLSWIPGLPAATWIDESPSADFTFSGIGETHELSYTPGPKLNGDPDYSATYTGTDVTPFIGTDYLQWTVTNIFSVPPQPLVTGTSTPVDATLVQVEREPRVATVAVELVYTYIPAP